MKLSRAFLAFVLLMSSVALSAEERLVGNLGDPDQVEFHGNETFTARQIRAALGRDMSILAKGHPLVPLNGFLTTLAERVREGYLTCGFAEVKVEATFNKDRSRIVVSIQEGPRRRCGKVEVIGAQSIPIERLVDSLTTARLELTESTTKSIDALWSVGDPAPFCQGFGRAQEGGIKKAFQSLGFFDVTFKIDVRPESDGTATLIVKIIDEGPRAYLGNIEVVGASKNSAEDVIKYLDLPDKLILDSDETRRIELKLREAARFLKHDVSVISPPFGDGPSILRIKLEESEYAPPLTQEFSPEERAMVRLADWLNHVESTNNDFEGRVVWPLSTEKESQLIPGALIPEFRFTISNADKGALIVFRLVQVPDREVCEYWIHATPRCIKLLSPRNNQAFEVNEFLEYVTFRLLWEAMTTDAEGRTSRCMIRTETGKSDFVSHTGAVTNGRPRLPFSLFLHASPVATLIEVHKKSSSPHLEDGVLKIDYPDGRLEVDCETGRLIALNIDGKSPYKGSAAFRPGLYRERLAEFETVYARARLIESGSTPVSNLLYFLATCTAESSSDASQSNKSLLALVHLLSKRGAFHPFDNVVRDYFDRPRDAFRMLPDSKLGKVGAAMNQFTTHIAVARLALPHDSWAMSLIREFIFAVSTNSSSAIQTMLQDKQSGPLSNAATAYVFGMASPQLKQMFARIGLTRLERQFFQQDYEPFVSESSPIGRILLASAETLQELDDTDVQSIVKLLPLSEEEKQALDRVLRQFSERRSEKPVHVLRSALDEAWEPLIQPRIREVLQWLAN